MKRLFIIALLLFACTERGDITLVPQAADVGTVRQVFVGTSRAKDASTAGFGGDRSESVAFVRYDVSIPPNHRPGTITWPRAGGTPDPAKDFVTTAIQRYQTPPAFRADLARALQKPGRGRDEAVIFVHGFNTTFSEGLYRFAQLYHDVEVPGVAVHFSWPSSANALGYVYDRDSALFARDGLDQLIHEVEAAGARRIILAAHSLGSALTMETLRQIALRGDKSTLDRIAGVVLISPDVDIDVFRAQAHAIGTLPQPFVIFTSSKDRALGFLSRLNGQPERLGNLRDVSRVADLRVTLLDTQAFQSGVGHFNPGDSPALIKLLARFNEVADAFESDATRRPGLLPGVVLTVQNATQIILSPVVALDSAARR